MTNSTPRFVKSASTDVPDPFDDVMVRVVELGLEHFEIAHLKPGWGERNLENPENLSVEGKNIMKRQCKTYTFKT